MPHADKSKEKEASSRREGADTGPRADHPDIKTKGGLLMIRLKLALAVAPLALAAFTAVPAMAQVTLNVSPWVPTMHPIHTNMVTPWGKEIEAATQGRVKINILPKGVVAAPQHVDAARDGVTDLAYIVHGYTPGRFLLSQVAEFPFLGDTAEATSVAYQRIYERHLAKAEEHKGVIVLGVFTHGPGQIFNAKRPIEKLADLDGLKIRVGGGIINDICKAIGVTALLKPAPESFELMKSGVADGVFFPKESVTSFKLETLVKHATLVPGGLYNTSFAMVANPARFNALPAADREAILKLSGEHLARLFGKGWDKADEDGMKGMQAAGIAVRTGDAALVNDIKARTESLEKDWIAKVKEKGIDGAAVLADFRGEIRKVGM